MNTNSRVFTLTWVVRLFSLPHGWSRLAHGILIHPPPQSLIIRTLTKHDLESSSTILSPHRFPSCEMLLYIYTCTYVYSCHITTHPLLHHSPKHRFAPHWFKKYYHRPISVLAQLYCHLIGCSLVRNIAIYIFIYLYLCILMPYHHPFVAPPT